MRSLVVFDNSLDDKRLSAMVRAHAKGEVSLFPLTSRWDRIEALRAGLSSPAIGKLELMGSARLIEGETDRIREILPRWSAGLGMHKIEGKTLKEHFLLPGTNVSTWFFSLLSEKNPLKTDAFLHIAQLSALEGVVSAGGFDLCIIAVKGGSLRRALYGLCRRHSLAFKGRGTGRPGIGLSYISVARALRFAYSAVMRSMYAKLRIGPMASRMKDASGSTLFVTYFPSVEKEAADEGIFSNRYAAPLQEKLEEMGKRVIWVWMYVFIDGRNFAEAVKLAASFVKRGERGFLLDEFVSVKTLSGALLQWARQVRVLGSLNAVLTDRALRGDLPVPESAIIVRELMIDSFAGRKGLEGILFFELYKDIFRRFSDASTCLYYSEMHAWEKALNAAKDAVVPRMRSIGFQHTNVPRNFFPYFHHPDETADRKGVAPLPLPDILACNGETPMGLMARCGYPDMRKVEAIRHLYIGKALEETAAKPEEAIVLIAGSIDRNETKNLISFFHNAFREPEGFELWVKGHPSVPVEDIMKELKIPSGRSGWRIRQEPIGELLQAARVVFVGFSSVALEALASGCFVILPVFADHISMSPLKGFEEYYEKVFDAEELRSAVRKGIGPGAADPGKGRTFAAGYWCIDRSLKRWEEILR
ncbi:MAG: hypothetical protein WC515_07390 [Candidatus Omnitrophota bacterium]